MAESFATSTAANLASKLGEYLFAPIGHQFGYVLYYKSYVADLKNEVEELEAKRARVQCSVDEAVYDGKLIHIDIKNWLNSVENKAKEAQDLWGHGENAKDACFCGWLPNPVVRYPIGKKVKKMTPVIQGLLNESANSDFQKVYYENPPIGIVTATTPPARFVDNNEVILESRALIMEDVMKALADDHVNVIGVHGPPGVGKSKLLKDIEKRVKEGKLFDVVATANVSRIQDLQGIQRQIAYSLGLRITSEETAHESSYRLCKRLERDPEKKILIILDDLWEKLELKQVGIPCGDDNKVRGCKLLLTSRNREVLRTEMDSDREFPLDVLPHAEARILFETVMRDKVDYTEFESSIDGVVENCGGLPLIILPMAKRLKRGDSAVWRNALTNRAEVESMVQLIYNDLKDEDQIVVLGLCSKLWENFHEGFPCLLHGIGII